MQVSAKCSFELTASQHSWCSYQKFFLLKLDFLKITGYKSHGSWTYIPPRARAAWSSPQKLGSCSNQKVQEKVQKTTYRSMCLQPHCTIIGIAGVEWIPMQEIWHYNQVTRQSNFIRYLPSWENLLPSVWIKFLVSSSNYLQLKEPFAKF